MADAMVSEIELKSGDRVKLKSGGPMMTVSNVADGKAECSWFFEGNLRHESFKIEVLKTFAAKKDEEPEAE